MVDKDEIRELMIVGIHTADERTAKGAFAYLVGRILGSEWHETAPGSEALEETLKFLEGRRV